MTTFLHDVQLKAKYTGMVIRTNEVTYYFGLQLPVLSISN